MPTTIDSAGIIFNDATSFTSATLTANSVGATQIANGSVTAAKLGTTEQKQICKAWVNFNGNAILVLLNGASGSSLSVTSGSNTGTFVAASPWTSDYVGTIYYIVSIGGVSGATFGGLNVATSGIQIVSVSGNTANVRFLAGNATSSQTITGNGTSSGFVFTNSGIRSSYNVSSVTKNGTGDYTVNFATPMADSNYSATYSSSGAQIAFGGTFSINNYKFFTGYVSSIGGSATQQDSNTCSVQIFGN